MILQYTERAQKDIEEAFVGYENKRRGLGFEFLDCIEVAIKNIIRFPEIYQKAHSQFRRAVIRRFPYSVFYTIENSIIIVHSVFACRQNPEKAP